ncbi:hypothetical protein RugamoR64_55780 [Duganella rhizosphaerae]|uniref:ABC transporter permease n=1 Tax=Duganella rhizosphaerae TaxID=2885763 RepID=UPI0030E76C6A
MNTSSITAAATPASGATGRRVFGVFARIAFASYFRNWVSVLMASGVPLIFFVIYLIPISMSGGAEPSMVVLTAPGLPAAELARLQKLKIPGLELKAATGTSSPDELLASQQARMVLAGGTAGHGLVLHIAPGDHVVALLLARALRASSTAEDGAGDISILTSSLGDAETQLGVAKVSAGILVMALLNLGLFSAGVKLLQDRSSGALRLYRNFPVPFYVYIGAELATRLLFVVLQTAFMLGLAFAFYHFQMGFQQTLLTLLVATLCGIPLILLGYALGAVLPNLSKGVHAFTITNLVTCFLGDLFMPASSVDFLRPIVFFMPTTHVSNLLRIVMADAHATFAVWQSIVFLAVFSVLALWFTVKNFKYTAGE